MTSINNWWETFFDEDYILVWGGIIPAAQTAEQAEGLWQLLKLREGARVLDAPCGYGRLSRPIAERGAIVVGVDQSEALLRRAESDRGALSENRLRYFRQDLRTPLTECGFDAAFNVYSSIGYGSEDDDLAVFRTLHAALRPGGLVVVDTMHRDAAAANLARGANLSRRLADGTLVVEELAFDPIAGRMNSRWFWSGLAGSGEKSASLRMYCVTELINLMAQAGLRFVSAYRGCSMQPFKAEGLDMGSRIAILAERPVE